MTRSVQVVVTCYNHAPYIQQCLESIFSQTHRDIRLAVYNDGSTDQSPAIIEATLLGSPFAETAYHSQVNQGLVVTRNLALETYLGQASYLLFVDSDNFLEPDYIEQLLTRAEAEDADIVYADLVDPETGCLVTKAIPFDLASFYADNCIDSCSLIRQSIIGTARYDLALNYKKLEDYDFFFQLLVRQKAKAVNCPSTFLNYRVLDNAMSARSDLKKYYDTYFYILGKFFTDHPDLARAALVSNYQRLYQTLSIEAQYSQQEIVVYYDQGQGFREGDKLTFPLERSGQETFSLPDQVVYLRLDLSELPGYYERVALVDDSYQTQLFPIGGNGLRLGEGYAFNNTDPQLIYDLRGTGSVSFTLTYKRANISDLGANDYLLKTLSQDLTELEGRHWQQEKELLSLRRLCQQQQEDLVEITQRYNSVVHSRRWLIPSKLIDFFRRKP